LRRNGTVIGSTEITAVLEVEPLPDVTIDLNAPSSLAMETELSSASTIFAFASPALEPAVFEPIGDGHFRIVVRFQPLNQNQFVGQPVDMLSDITRVTTHYEDVLRAAGVHLVATRLFTVRANELPAVTIEALTPPSTSADAAYDVTAFFRAAPINYRRALDERIEARINTISGSGGSSSMTASSSTASPLPADRATPP
jgi:hypothetical protein